MLKITEQQGRGNENLDRESDLKQNYLKWFNLKGKHLLVFLGLFFLSFGYPTSLNSKTTVQAGTKKWYELDLPSRESLRKLDSELITEVEKYIDKNSYGSKLKATALIDNCVEHNFDLILAISQAQVESHFGTRGAASHTGSVFNVGTYDDGTILYRYRDPNLSIEPYISLLKRRYLVNQKTVEDLLRPRSFVNYKGLRYASERRYEYLVKGVYDNILSETSIDSLWAERMDPEIIRAMEIYNYQDCLLELINSKI